MPGAKTAQRKARRQRWDDSKVRPGSAFIPRQRRTPSVPGTVTFEEGQ
jgi:hypothetical protein